jgi:hypothetical protein
MSCLFLLEGQTASIVPIHGAARSVPIRTPVDRSLQGHFLGACSSLSYGGIEDSGRIFGAACWPVMCPSPIFPMVNQVMTFFLSSVAQPLLDDDRAASNAIAKWRGPFR